MLKIPSPFAPRPKPDEPPPVILDDVKLPWGLHPLVDFVRFTLLLMENQDTQAKAINDLQRRFLRLRLYLLGVMIASLAATFAQVMQLWLAFR